MDGVFILWNGGWLRWLLMVSKKVVVERFRLGHGAAVGGSVSGSLLNTR